jgi:hypothetical protein
MSEVKVPEVPMLGSIPTSNPKALFATLVSDESDLQAVKMMVNSKRTFAGRFANSPTIIFTLIEIGNPFSEFPEVNVVGIHQPPTLAECLFGAKVLACKVAEETARQEGRVLIWIDPACLLLRPPEQLLLTPPHKAALRPVHIMNIGQPVGQPLNGFWRQIYDATGNRMPDYSLQSYIDAVEILPYFNTHCFSLDSSLGICAKWMATLDRLWNDETFLPHFSNSLQRVFLFQAVLSAVITSSLDRNEIHLLSPDYSYPYHLQAKIPPEKQAKRLEELTCVVYEEESIHPHNLRDIEVIEPLKSWLRAHAAVGVE